MGWYRDKKHRSLISGYYCALRETLKKSSPKDRCLTSCKYCGILFLTAPSNRNRKDILCPFGCRFHVKRKSSVSRVASYYKSCEGKKKKKILNQRRYLHAHSKDESKNLDQKKELISFDPMISIVRLTIKLFEGKKLSKKSCAQFLEDLKKKWRQHPLEYWLKYYKIDSG